MPDGLRLSVPLIGTSHWRTGALLNMRNMQTAKIFSLDLWKSAYHGSV
jgi:hypothetical protein